jgi:hypothetical protein
MIFIKVLKLFTIVDFQSNIDFNLFHFNLFDFNLFFLGYINRM